MNAADDSSKPPWVRARETRDRQLALRQAHRVTVLGTGPDSAVGGWRVGAGRWVRCSVCGYLLPLDGETTDTCWCGAMHSDAAAGRIGSDLGDQAIERVRLEPL
jgi:hypothetical protein